MTKRLNTNKFVAILAVLCMITSAFVGSTLAKYTTSTEGSDKARVAKFGVVLTAASNSNFSTEYEDTTNGLTVKSSTTDSVVAPGTADANGITFTIDGTPEVATKLTIEMSNNEEVFLAAGTYTDYTKRAEDGSYKTFTLDDNYYPVKFTLKQTEGYYNNNGTIETVTNPVTIVDGKTLADVKSAVEAASMPKIDANAKLDATYVLTWEWAFDNNQDAADTYLGNLAADKLGNTTTFGYSASDEGTKYNLDINYDIKFVVEQID